MHIDFPYHVDGRDRTAAAEEADYIRDLIEQILFTTPGERVNRPDFGSGVMQLVFGPASDEIAATTEFLIKGALQRWLGDLIAVDAVEVIAEESVLLVRVDYTVLSTQTQARAEIVHGGGTP